MATLKEFRDSILDEIHFNASMNGTPPREEFLTLYANALADAEERALEIIGGTAAAHAVENITKNRSVVTGRLRGSITHKPEDETTVAIGSDVEYSPYVELGTSRARAKPYLRPAIQDNIPEYKRIAEGELSDLLG